MCNVDLFLFFLLDESTPSTFAFFFVRPFLSLFLSLLSLFYFSRSIRPQISLITCTRLYSASTFRWRLCFRFKNNFNVRAPTIILYSSTWDSSFWHACQEFRENHVKSYEKLVNRRSFSSFSHCLRSTCCNNTSLHCILLHTITAFYMINI